MIRNLKYKLIRSKKHYNIIAAIFLSLILIFEIYSWCSLNDLKENKKGEVYKELEGKNEVKLDDMVEQLVLNGLNILSIEKNDDNYNLVIRIQGKKDEVCKTLKKLTDYKIVDYEFNVESDNIEGNVKLSYN